MQYVLQAGLDGQYGPFGSILEAVNKADELFSLEPDDRSLLLSGGAIPYTTLGEVIEIYEVED